MGGDMSNRDRHAIYLAFIKKFHQQFGNLRRASSVFILTAKAQR